MIPEIKLKKLDMKKAKEHNHPDIKVGKATYLVNYGGNYFVGQFNKEWFGLNFNGWYNHLQFDAPGSNHSDWKQIWEIIEVKK